MAGASPAFDRLGDLGGAIVTVRGRRGRDHDPRLMLHQPAGGTRNIRRQAAGPGVDEVSQVGDPGHTTSREWILHVVEVSSVSIVRLLVFRFYPPNGLD